MSIGTIIIEVDEEMCPFRGEEFLCKVGGRRDINVHIIIGEFLPSGGAKIDGGLHWLDWFKSTTYTPVLHNLQL